MKPIKLIADVEAEDRLLVCMLAAPDSEIDKMKDIYNQEIPVVED